MSNFTGKKFLFITQDDSFIKNLIFFLKNVKNIIFLFKPVKNLKNNKDKKYLKINFFIKTFFQKLETVNKYFQNNEWFMIKESPCILYTLDHFMHFTNIFLNFYRFPKNVNLREKWVAQIKKDVPIIITQYTRLCSKHFTNDDYYQSSFGNYILKPDAVPSRFFCSRKSLLSGIKKNVNNTFLLGLI